MKRKFATVLIIVLLITLAMANTGCVESEKKPVLGDYAKSYLSGNKYTKLIIEIDYVEGYEISDKALNTLKSRINYYCDKPDGIFDIDDGITSSKTTYSDGDIRKMEEKHRDYHKSGNDIVLYVLYLNGEYAKDEDVLGLAYGASSMAIFKEKIDGISIPFWAQNQVDNEDYEKSVLVHEFGHVLALVNIGYESERDHEDVYKHHCIHDECVMYYSVESVSIINLITQDDPKPPSDFCGDCRHDLSKLKSGEY